MKPGPDPPNRQTLFATVLDPARVRAAEREAQEFNRFCDRLRILAGVDSLCLYLTWRTDLGDTSRLLRRRLAKLNLAARLHGSEPWTSLPSVRRYLRGLHRDHAIGAEAQRADPLYLELVSVLVSHAMAITLDQHRDRAAILLSTYVRTPATAIARLRWPDVHWTKHGVRLDLPVRRGRKWVADRNGIEIHARDDGLCLVSALRRLRQQSPSDQVLVFGRDKPVDARRVRSALENLRLANGDIDLALQRLSPSPVQLRDRALLILGYGTALRTFEAVDLRVKDVTVCPEGLLVTVPGRQSAVGLPVDPGMPTDPVAAWEDWTRELEHQGFGGDDPAFPYVNGPVITHLGLGQVGLNRLVQRMTRSAEIEGSFSFCSLRTGMIRTAIRRNEHAHAIATHTDLRSLQSLRRHELRETLLSRSIAGQVGL